MIDAAYQKQDPSGEARMVIVGFGEHPADANQAGYGRDGQMRMALDKPKKENGKIAKGQQVT